MSTSVTPPPQPSPIRVLLVEDNPGDALLVREALRDVAGMRFEVDQVDLLRDALERLAQSVYDVILLDLRLPDSEGLGTLVAMLGAAGGVPIVVMTGIADERLATAALRQGAQDYLVKGEVAGDTLARSIRYAMSRRVADDALRETTSTLQALIDASPLAIIVLDRERKVQRWNRAAETLFGWSEAEVLGLRPPHMAEVEREEFERMIDAGLKGEKRIGLEVKRRRKDGSTLDVSLWTAQVHDARGNVVGLLGILADITERKRLEERLSQAQKMEAIGRLAGGVAHDFNNLLTVILGYAEVVQTRLPRTDPLQREVGEVRKAATRAASLTNQLLAFSRRQVMRARVVDLNVVVENFSTMLQRLIGKDVEVVLDLARNLGEIRADPGQIEQVLMNLAVNARDAMPSGGRLVVSTRNLEVGPGALERLSELRATSYVVLTVSDTGAGMDAATLAHAFEPFFTTKEPGKGTGLGLATVYGVVRQSGGEIRVTSELGRGTTFNVYLPRVEASADTSARGSRETVLLVEDDEAVRGVVRQALESHGYGVLEAATHEQVARLCAAHEGPIPLVIADVALRSSVDGEPLPPLPAARAGTKVLYIARPSSQAAPAHLAAAIPVRMPFAPDELLAQVRRQLDV